MAAMQNKLAKNLAIFGIHLSQANDGIGPSGDCAINGFHGAILSHVRGCGDAVDADEILGAVHGLDGLGCGSRPLSPNHTP
jgi:hypothetical protein